MFGIFKSLSKSNSDKNKKYYEKIKKLTNSIIDLEQKTNINSFQKVINNIRITIWVENNLTTINIKIIENTDYEFSLNFDNNKYTFSKTNYNRNNSLELDIVNLDSFEENIEIIFLDVIDKTIEFLQVETKKNQDEKNAKDIKQKNLIDKLAQDIQNTPLSKNIQEENNTYPLINYSFMITAIENFDVEAIKKYINLGAYINSQDIDGNTPLIVAVKKFDLDFVKLLIKKGANEDIENSNGETALSIAKQREYRAIIDILSENNISQKNLKIANNKTEKNSKTIIPLDKIEKQITPIEGKLNNQIVEDSKPQIDSFKETILSQSNEMKELQNKLITKEQETKDLVDSLVSKIESHENKYDAQNKFIKSINSEIEHLKTETENSVENNQIEELKLQAKVFQSTLTYQTDKIIELQNQLITKEQETKDLVDSLVSKIESHENKYDAQNKFIKSINSEIEHLKTETRNSVENNQIEELTLQVKVFQSTLTYQSNKIIELQNQLITKEQKTKTLVDSFMSKINKLEEKIAKQKVVKTQIPINIPTEKQSIKKDDGVIVKRESFDDF